MSGVTISVAMCTHNGARFLRPQLESIAAQTRLPDELVVCDDRSEDKSPEVVHAFGRVSPFKVRFEENAQNLGPSRNFEKAISLCRSEVVALADQDDVWYPHKLQRIVEAMGGSQTPVAVFSDADLIDENSVLQGRRLWESFLFHRREQKQFENGSALDVLAKHPVVTGATMAFRRELITLMTPIPPHHIHDGWMAFLLAARGPFAVIPDALMQYRQHSGQQIGPGPGSLNFSGRIQFAITTGGRLWLEEIKRFKELRDLLDLRKSDFSHGAYARKKIDEKILHLERRAGLPQAKAARVPGVVREVFKGTYWRYSGGWRSVAKDLMMNRPDEFAI